jgi:hypothetical protein
MFGAIRILSLIVILLFISFSLSAQEYTKAVGVRGVFGFDHYQYAGAEFSFQKDVREIGRTEYDFFATIDLNLGFDYTFGFLQLALDWRPEWTVINNFGTQLGYDVGFALRFAIP